MKGKLNKILGIGLTLVLTLALVAGFALPAGAAVEKLNEWYIFDYPEAGEAGDWFYDPDIDEVREITEAINGDLYVYVDVEIPDPTDGYVYDHIFKSTDGGRSWEATGYDEVEVCEVDTDVFSNPGRVLDMVCSSIDEDIVYATDGFYVYKTTDGGDEWDFVARDSLETRLGGECGCCLSACIDAYDDLPALEPDPVITSIDVTYDGDDNPFVFIGTKAHSINISTGCLECVDIPEDGTGMPGDVYYIGEAGYPADWTSLNLCCFHGGGYNALAVGCAPDWADTKLTYVVISASSDVDVTGAHTWVAYTTGTVCGWYEFAELLRDCDPDYHFESWHASRIGFPDDWEDTESLFVGVTTPFWDDGGDVYLVWQDYAQDMNVEGIVTGCEGKEDDTDIISLDIMGDTDEASLIAGEFWDNKVYYSYDGGWEWDESEKDPTGSRLTYVIWYEDTALAATSGNECAVSMSCGEEVGQFWNQISLIATDITAVLWNDHSPGYITESETLFMLTRSNGEQSLFRYDGTYWERVYCSTIAGADETWAFDQVHVSPDFNETNTVYLANSRLEAWRTTDAGCSWDKLTFPCSPRPYISAGVVIDEDTVITGGAGPDAGWVFKTTRHGARPWDDYEVTGAGWVMSFDLEPGYEDPGTVLLGDNQSQVFISEDGGETWDLVEAALDTTAYDTSVVFDPEYATNNTIYAAAGNVIARCIIDPDLDWADQEWEEIYTSHGDVYFGMVTAGDTALYVTDTALVDVLPVVSGHDEDGGVLRSLNPDAEDKDDVVFERLTEELVEGDTGLWRLMLTVDVSDEGCAENVLWARESESPHHENIWTYEDTLAVPIVLDMPLNEQKLGTTDEATLSWNELCGADCYEVSLWRYCPECPDEKLEIEICGDCGDLIDTVCHECVEDICIVVEDLESGCTYYWQVRVCIGEPKLSKWSEERTFMTALLAVPFKELCSPPCGDQDIILTPNFSWEAVDGATGYDIELATTETFTAGVIRGSSTVNAWVLTAPLDYATTYYWRVRAEKDGVFSDWTVCLFTTMEEPVPAPPPVVVEPTPPAPVVPAPIIEFPPTPSWVWAIIGIGTALVVVVIVLTVRTRRPPA